MMAVLNLRSRRSRVISMCNSPEETTASESPKSRAPLRFPGVGDAGVVELQAFRGAPRSVRGTLSPSTGYKPQNTMGFGS